MIRNSTQNSAAGLSVLLVDDEQINLTILESCLRTMGMAVFKAQSGLEALEVFQRKHPDMVLMDVMMPGMDGLEATRQVKRLCGERWVPVVMVTSLYSGEDIVGGLEAGADDYLVKPVNFQILKSKIANIALVIRQQQALRKYHDDTEAEQEFAMEVMERLIRPMDHGDKLHCWSMPTSRFNGDVIVAGDTPDGRMQVVLADGTGHGLAAALNVIPVVEVFYGMNDKGLPIEEIAYELNDKLHRTMPTGHFVAAAILSIDQNAGEIRVWNGGIPFAVFISTEGVVLHEWRSKSLPLGVVDKAQFENTTEVFRCDQEGFFFTCSDGLLEAEDTDGNPVGKERLLGWLKEKTPDRISHIAEQLLLYLHSPAHDDVTFLIAPYRPAGLSALTQPG